MQPCGMRALEPKARACMLKGVDHVQGGFAATRRVGLESRESLYGLDRRGALAKGASRSQGGWALAEAARLRFRSRLNLGAQARDQDAVDRAGGDGSDVDPCPRIVASQRAPLWCIAGTEQGGDGGQVRRRAGENLAAKLRHAAAAAPRWRPPTRAERPALCGSRPQELSADRVSQGYSRAV